MEDRYYSRLIKVMVFIVDFYLISIAFTLAKKLGLDSGLTPDQSTSFLLIFGLCWVIAGFNKIYHLNKFSLIKTISTHLLGILLVHAFLITAIMFAFEPYRVPVDYLLAVYVCTAVMVIASRVTYKLLSKYLEFSGFDQRRFVIIGATPAGKSIQNFFESHDLTRYHFRGYFDDNKESTAVDPSLIKGTLADVKDFCVRENIDEIYFALPLTEKALISDIQKFADDNCIYFRIAPDFSSVVAENYNVLLYDTLPVLTTRREPLGITINAVLKRAFDIVFSLLVILTVFPIVVPIIALAIRLDSKGPIIFKQLRLGRKNKLFECYKFRTMVVDANPEQQATKNDPRVTRVGRFLRKTNLDELPQFVNVLMGSMSVVGPRPQIKSQLDQYSGIIQKYKMRHFVNPGITGYAQVNGYRGETKEVEQMEKRVEYDVKYMENWSLSLDLKIIFLTVWNMLRGERTAY
ncbi:MAG: undecaprenyl-phosphate glucose phosphotransferase [Bacteroidota bacterium]|jgi:putative colanic acid biosynthesis UDP-glucose lipid carrier transferase|nr:MAG: undecaprenyl-phosphate glucose phosphotransferase [Bacteroidota bacterium]